uniref:Metalloendopeptidase n=1 Tax=Hydractinia echinata TaxID=3283270 RepID=Q2MCX7_HYDEC|nr:astacin 3 [Hydractinia echinata]
MTDKLRENIREMRLRALNGLAPFDAIRGGVWPGGVVPYRFAGNFPYKRAVWDAIKEYNAETCIRFKPYTAALAKKAGGYVEFMQGGGCSSYIGRQRGRQQISLANGCGTKGVAIHEMMHALGFYHEQSRLDRDKYITIHWNNINKRMWFNFEKYRSGAASTLGEPYDKSSIMHYGSYAFSINRRKTIVSKSSPNERLGQRQGLSRIDKNQLNKYYSCKKTVTKVTKRPPTACQNMYSFCGVLGKWCSNNWVKGNCKKKCKLCNKSACKDKSRYCRSWARSRYCNHSKHKPYMVKNCKRSCGLCS